MDILFVCYANVCRSATAERITRCAATGFPGLGELRLSASSAGTHAEPGMPMHPVARTVLVESGVGVAGFTSRVLSAQLLDRAGLVLAVARQQRAVCVTLAPATLRRTFTLRQFGRLASHVDPDRLHSVAPQRRLPALIDEVLRVRDEVQPVPGEEDDLADPAGGPVAEMRACAAQIRASLRPVLTLLAGPRPSP